MRLAVTTHEQLALPDEEQRLRKALELLLAWARGQKVDFAEVEAAIAAADEGLRTRPQAGSRV